ncbi:hypothetical protein DP117_09645 [Brasilonema sp. UFV-L1]|uniref:hypothetical protein n=1 Tax=Brasilonema sp. UFV-L1 TaxID=2234130 RepID=UPI001696E905|nr:hypothetical protein [Brasilonema sp. UFV-L1]
MTNDFPKHYVLELLNTLKVTTVAGTVSALVCFSCVPKALTERAGIGKLQTLLAGVLTAHATKELLTEWLRSLPEQIRILIEDWEERCNTTSPRFEQAKELFACAKQPMNSFGACILLTMHHSDY